ncbi:MAG TPA: prepilin-type N-terminal cleavage/methylation domain-containing protein, partial [Candidatus Saccharibacteria bacterium]|nr:prepilin-type N-terminal cleavage/methylation domain-containing protein [Candidatus Saccharibacteria bacterium]
MGIRQKYIRGFTIVELLIVIVIIGILATVTAIVYSGIQASARDTSVLSDLDTMDGLQTSYSLKNGGNAKPYYSGDGPDSELGFTASGDNVIDVVTNGDEYCIRGYNVGGTKTTIDNAFTKESSSGVCELLSPSAAAIA